MTPFAPPPEFDGYRVVQLLGQGGMGAVYLAEDTLLERQVAVKFISQADDDPVARRRFLVEARAIARLQHPNVVSVYRVGEVLGRPYLVSEFVRGTPLDSVQRPLPTEELIAVGLDISRALAAAHRRGVLHRDIKPSNAIRSEEGETKLLDFGIAKLVGPVGPVGEVTPATNALPTRADEATPVEPVPRPNLAERWLTRPGALVGTPGYMAPEVWDGLDATFRSDLYSLGALLYALASGRPPHAADTVEEICRRATSEDPPPVVLRAPGLPRQLAAIIDRCVARRPADRFQTANELRTALAQLTREARPTATPEGSPYRGLQPFGASHEGVFFGRDSEIRMVLERLARQPLAVVVGDSGVGKSSLCRAGVLPRVQQWLGSERRWSTASLVPGRHPVTALSVALAPLVGLEEEAFARAVEEDPSGVARRLRGALGSAEGLVLFVDQLEELATLCDPSEAAAVSELLGWLSASGGAVRLLATARGDFLTRLAELPHIGEEVSRALYFLRPLSAERIREAIVGPAQAKGVRFESEELVEELVESTAAAQGGLPLLQFTLAQLWASRSGEDPVLTRSALDAMGGVTGALSRHADEVLAQLLPPEREAARQVLVTLVSASGTRARRTREELVGDSAAAARALDALVRGRLLVARVHPEGTSYDVAHEALIGGWATLAGWLVEDQALRQVRERLRSAVSEWERLGAGPEGLYCGRRLKEAQALVAGELSAPERRFLRRSRRRARRSRALRWAAGLAIPLVAALSWGGLRLAAHQELEHQVAAARMQAAVALGDARTRQVRAEQARTAALEAFDSQQPDEGEARWASYLEARGLVSPRLGAAARELEAALLLDPERPALRGLFAELIFERALLAEERSDAQALAELLQRLAVHDIDGALGARWDAKATLDLDTELGATVELSRYVRTAAGPLRPEPIGRHGARITGLQLAPGSYLAVASAPGRATVRLPFTLRRGEQVRWTLPLPQAVEVPEGFVHVPAGRFLFGSGAPDEQRRDFFHAPPLHSVETQAFRIARYETTFADWIRFLEALPEEERAARLPRVGTGGFQGGLQLSRDPGSGQWRLRFKPVEAVLEAAQGERVRYPGRARRAAQDWLRLPVVGIAVADAEAYVAWLRSAGGVPGARLCTEQEWERAARGADDREFPHGAATLEPDDANFDDTYGKAPKAMGPDEVGSHPASESPFGVHDLAGNVWEWTRSSLTADGYVARGGSFYFSANSARAPERQVTEPSFRDVSVGMRVCADAGAR